LADAPDQYRGVHKDVLVRFQSRLFNRGELY
jgi:hypothetical protein